MKRLAALLLLVTACNGHAASAWTAWGRLEYPGLLYADGRSVVGDWRPAREFPSLDDCQRWVDKTYSRPQSPETIFHLECLPTGQIPGGSQ